MSVIVTGAAGHLGRAIAADIVEAGRAVVLVDRDADRLDEVAGSLGGDGMAVATDVTDPDSNRSVVEQAVARFGSVEACVPAAGIEGPTGFVETLEPSDVEAVFRINTLAIFWMAAAVVPVFKSQGEGRFVPIASGAGRRGGALTTAYNASKHAVVGLTKSMAKELAADNIAVNAVCPGYVDSPMVDRIAESERAVLGSTPDYARRVPAARKADPSEIASVVKYLVCDAPSYLTGTCVVIDGALSA